MCWRNCAVKKIAWNVWMMVPSWNSKVSRKDTFIFSIALLFEKSWKAALKSLIPTMNENLHGLEKWIAINKLLNFALIWGKLLSCSVGHQTIITSKLVEVAAWILGIITRKGCSKSGGNINDWRSSTDFSEAFELDVTFKYPQNLASYYKKHHNSPTSWNTIMKLWGA